MNYRFSCDLRSLFLKLNSLSVFVLPVGSRRRHFVKLLLEKYVYKFFIILIGSKLSRKEIKYTQQVIGDSQPLITVVIPCYNYGHYIQEAIDSVLNQTFQRFEVIVVDGGSGDSTLEVLRKIKHDKISVYFRQGRHLVGSNRNFGIDKAIGKYICCLDADDLLLPTYLEKALFYAELYNLDVVYPSVQLFGHKTDKWIVGTSSFERMLKTNYIPTAAVFKKDAWAHVGGYRDWPVGKGHVPEDWDFWTRVYGAGFRLDYIQEPLMLYRVHGSGLTAKCDTSISLQRKEIAKSSINYKRSSEYKKKRIYVNDTVFKSNVPELNLLRKKGDRKTILLALPFSATGGADTILLKIFKELSKKYEIIVTTFKSVPDSFGDNDKGYLEITPFFYKLDAFLKSEEEKKIFSLYLMKAFSVDCLFIVGSSLYYDLIPKLKDQNPSLKIVDQLFNEIGYIKLNRQHALNIDLSIVASPIVRDVLIKDYGEVESKVNMIVHGVDSEQLFNPKNVIVDRKKTVSPKLRVSFFGRMSDEKNPIAFLEIAKQLRGGQFEFLMVGNGPLDSHVKSYIANSDLLDSVEKLSFVDDIRPYILSSDILIVPSLIEGLPILILESLALGVPVLASNVGAVSLAVRDGITGFLCSPENLDTFICRLKELEVDRSQLNRMKCTCRDVSYEFSERRMNENYLLSINNLLSE